MHTRIGASSRILRGFARDPSRSKGFPDSAAFYESDTFLDTPISNTVRLRREAEEYTPAQQRQAIQKSTLRIICHWTKRYMILGGERQNPRLVDEAWSVYVGEELNRECPNSLAATALKREGNFGREGAIDVPLPEAMVRAQQVAADMDDAAYSTAAPNVYSRFDAIYYLEYGTIHERGPEARSCRRQRRSGSRHDRRSVVYLPTQTAVAKAMLFGRDRAGLLPGRA